MSNPPFKPEDLSQSLQAAIGEALRGANNWWNNPATNTLPEAFGSTHASGFNPQMDALLHYAAIAYFNAHSDFTGETEEQREAREAQLQAASQLAAQAFSEGRGDSPATAMQSVAAFSEALANDEKPLQQIIADFADTENLPIGPDSIALAEAAYQKLQAEETRCRDAMAALAAEEGGKAGSDEAGVTAPAEKATALMNEETKKAMLDKVDVVFNAGAAAGYPDISEQQRLITKAIVLTEATWLQKRWDVLSKDGGENSYLITETVYSGFEYGGAAISTGAAAISNAFDAYQKAGGEWTPERWDETLRTKADEVWKELKKTIGEEGAASFKAASEAVSDRLILRLADNTAAAFNQRSQHNMRGAWNLPTDTLQLIYDEDKALYAQLVGDINILPADAKVKYSALTALVQPETRSYSNALFLTDQGLGDQVPISESMVLAGSSPVAVIFENGYPMNVAATRQIGSVQRWANEPSSQRSATVEGGEHIAERPNGPDQSLPARPAAGVALTP